jgi:hypothetical protein
MRQPPEPAAAKSAGFASLAELASDIDALSIKDQTGRPQPTPAAVSTASTEPSFADAMDLREKQARRRKWLQPGIGAACYLIAVCWIVFPRLFGSHYTRPQPPLSIPPQATTQAPQDYEAPPTDGAAMRSEDSFEGALEQAPPPATGRNLSFAELHWCLAQKERLTAADAALRKHQHSQVVRFNNLVDYYNARCSDFRYYKPELERVENIIQAQKSHLDQQGVDLLNGKD